jgi:DNA end-binding protein Ku
MDQIVKGYEYDPGKYVILTEEDFKRAASEATQTIGITDFVTLGSIEYVYFQKPYYVVPGKKAEKGYVLLREVLKRTGKVAISQVVIRSRQYLSALVPHGNALVLNVLRYYKELRDPSELDLPGAGLEEYKITEREIEIAEMLVDTMTSEWDPKKYEDEYREALMSWIEKKIEAGGTVPVEEVPQRREEAGGKVIDMMELLKQSVQQVSKERGRQPRAGERKERSRITGTGKAAGGQG